MIKSLVLAASLCAATLAAFAQQDASPASASPAAPAASAPVKKRLHAPKLRKGAHAASNPAASPTKEGGA